ncbi:MAG: ABC transporter permease subunit [Angelakisella sp.]|nr:ABC transporter permease subunit [Angelakisella sp.]
MTVETALPKKIANIKKTNKFWFRFKNDAALYVLLLPAILYFVIFHLVPIIEMKLAFYDYRIIGENIFVGLKHFKKLFSTPLFAQIMKNTLIISMMKIILFFPLPVVFALLINEFRIGPFRKSIQVVSYLPHFLSWVVIAGIWFEFLGNSGTVNTLLGFINVGPIDFLTNKETIRWVLFSSEAWRSIGWDSIIYSAAIMGIAPELYEAATIDGATRWQIVRRIIIPALTTTMVTVLILNVGFMMNAGLDQILNFTNAAVNNHIDIIDTYVYRIGIQNGQYSFATAVNLFKGVIGTTLVVSTHLISKKLTGKGAW